MIDPPYIPQHARGKVALSILALLVLRWGRQKVYGGDSILCSCSVTRSRNSIQFCLRLSSQWASVSTLKTSRHLQRSSTGSFSGLSSSQLVALLSSAMTLPSSAVSSRYPHLSVVSNLPPKMRQPSKPTWSTPVSLNLVFRGNSC